jgi:elongation factor P hydroxylase
MISLPTLLALLNNKYLGQFNTQVVGGFDEPFYKSSDNGNKAEIQFSHDYIRSALHELSHWCVAGEERRELDDYGYWYAVDGRNQQQQDEFFKLEIKPQAIEWAFSIVCEVKFEASVDNLNNTVYGIEEFKENLDIQMQVYIMNGFSKRVSEIIKLMADNQAIDNYMDYISQKIQEM